MVESCFSVIGLLVLVRWHCASIFRVNMFKTALCLAALASSVLAQTTTLQAESATLSGVTVATSVAGYTGMFSKPIPGSIIH